MANSQSSWSEEWKKIGLGARRLPNDDDSRITNLLLVNRQIYHHTRRYSCSLSINQQKQRISPRRGLFGYFVSSLQHQHNAYLSSQTTMASGQSPWSEEWKKIGLGASRLPKDDDSRITNLLFVQMGFGVDQHGNDKSGGSGDGATKGAVRAVRNAIEFNSIPGVIEAVPGGREEMLISGEWCQL